jgi:Fe-S cluster assembly protein SufD
METIVSENRAINFRAIDKFEPDWLYKIRKTNWQAYNQLPLPDRAQHLWRYSKPEQFLSANIDALMNTLPVLPKHINGNGRPVSDEYAAIGYNPDDKTTLTKMSEELKQKKIIFKDLYLATRENEDLVSKYLGRLINHNSGKFEAFNMALWNGGYFLYLPDNAVIEKPILLNRHAGGLYAISRLLVIVGNNAQVTLIDDYSGPYRETSGNSNGVVEIFGGESSQIRYVNIQRQADNCISYITQRAEIGKGASIYSIFGAVGGATTKVNAGTILNGRGAESRMYGIVFGNESQHFDYHTMHHHKESESQSNINFKVVLKNKATSSYTGLIRIEKETANCEAYQENRNLLLNKGTRAESIPELEILTDQVRCTHGATMGPIDQNMLFYLKSRGVSHDEAVKIVISGFVEPTIAQMPGELQNLMRGLIMNKLEGAQL